MFDVILTGSKLKVTYTEPTTNKDGSALKDLAKVIVYANKNGAGKEVVKEIPATSVTGGGAIEEEITVAAVQDEEADVEFSAVAVDLSGNASPAPNPSKTVRIDHLAPANVS